MRAIDTNVVVRFLTGDHPTQTVAARAAIETGEVFVGVTVLLETEWVLRSVYGFSRTEIATALRGFAGLPTVSIEDPTLLAVALDRMEAGVDFADALHLGAARHCEAMLTFDRRFIEATHSVALRVMEPE